jgi:hypothetical protein
VAADLRASLCGAGAIAVCRTDGLTPNIVCLEDSTRVRVIAQRCGVRLLSISLAGHLHHADHGMPAFRRIASRPRSWHAPHTAKGIDVALRMGRLADSTLTARRIASGRHAGLGTPAYFERAGVPMTPGDLMAHEAVVYAQRGGGAVWTFRRDGAELAVSSRVACASPPLRVCARLC